MPTSIGGAARHFLVRAFGGPMLLGQFLCKLLKIAPQGAHRAVRTATRVLRQQFEPAASLDGRLGALASSSDGAWSGKHEERGEAALASDDRACASDADRVQLVRQRKRTYPWGSAPPDCTYANYYPEAPGCVGAADSVGSRSPDGDGRYGQSELAGNVWEWSLDWFENRSAGPCVDCTELIVTSYRTARGASWYDSASNLIVAAPSYDTPLARYFSVGLRCARTP